MPEFFDSETKQLDTLYQRLRALLADLDKSKLPLRSVTPHMLVTSTGTEEAPEVTAALVVIQVKGPTAVDALTQLEAAIRISAHGVQAEPSADETHLNVELAPGLADESEIPIDLEEETATLADVAEEQGLPACEDDDVELHRTNGELLN